MSLRGRRLSAGPGKKAEEKERSVGLATVAREWLKIGCIGFGGPPAHIALLRKLCVERRGWLTPEEFEDGVATSNLLPGPASTQLAMFCAWRIAGVPGVLIGGASFILPGLAIILGLSVLFLAEHPPTWISGAAGGAGSAVPAVAAAAAISLMPASWRRAGQPARQQAPWPAEKPADRAGPQWRRRRFGAPRLDWAHWRWIGYLVAG